MAREWPCITAWSQISGLRPQIAIMADLRARKINGIIRERTGRERTANFDLTTASKSNFIQYFYSIFFQNSMICQNDCSLFTILRHICIPYTKRPKAHIWMAELIKKNKWPHCTYERFYLLLLKTILFVE